MKSRASQHTAHFPPTIASWPDCYWTQARTHSRCSMVTYTPSRRRLVVQATSRSAGQFISGPVDRRWTPTASCMAIGQPESTTFEQHDWREVRIETLAGECG